MHRRTLAGDPVTAVRWPTGAGPDTGHTIITIGTAPCCGALPGDDHECPTWAAEADLALTTPITLTVNPTLVVDRG